jgi:hypothetical protein
MTEEEQPPNVLYRSGRPVLSGDGELWAAVGTLLPADLSGLHCEPSRIHGSCIVGI